MAEIKWSADTDVLNWQLAPEDAPNLIYVGGRFYRWEPNPKRWWQFWRGDGNWIELTSS